MCGIVGVISSVTSRDQAMEALSLLEYRGYDSFGLTVLRGDLLTTKKAVGSVSQKLKQGFLNDVEDGTATIAHTRWATHGGVTEANAHPHGSYDGAFSLVHNGVIENWQKLRAKLEASGIVFRSDTDTEVIVHLLAQEYGKLQSVRRAIEATLAQLEGEYAIVCVTTHEPGTLFAFRHKSPLCYGLGPTGAMVASDQSAVATLTREVVFLEDDDLLELHPDTASVYTNSIAGLKEVTRTTTTIAINDIDVGLGMYPHYMLKEIHEIPQAVQSALALESGAIDTAARSIAERTVTITGAGSAYYAALIGQYLFSELAQVYVRTHPSDEVSSLVLFGAGDHLIAVSQSGETYDTLEAMRRAREHGAHLTAITNVYASSISRAADHTLLQRAGREVCVLSTKSVVSQVVILYRLARRVGELRGVLSSEMCARLSQEEALIVPVVEKFLHEGGKIFAQLAAQYAAVHDWFYIGREKLYPVALESALKLKEVTYAHAEGMSAGFLKHGTISLIDDTVLTVAFLPAKQHDPELYELTLSNISEIRARNGRIIVIGHDSGNEARIDADAVVTLPSISKHLDPLLELIAGQLLAYHCAVVLGRPVDQPRSLAKAVTVR